VYCCHSTILGPRSPHVMLAILYIYINHLSLCYTNYSWKGRELSLDVLKSSQISILGHAPQLLLFLSLYHGPMSPRSNTISSLPSVHLHGARPTRENKIGLASTASQPIPAYTMSFVTTSTSYRTRGFCSLESISLSSSSC